MNRRPEDRQSAEIAGRAVIPSRTLGVLVAAVLGSGSLGFLSGYIPGAGPAEYAACVSRAHESAGRVRAWEHWASEIFSQADAAKRVNLSARAPRYYRFE